MWICLAGSWGISVAVGNPRFVFKETTKDGWLEVDSLVLC